jgi:hypothetical protein
MEFKIIVTLDLIFGLLLIGLSIVNVKISVDAFRNKQFGWFTYFVIYVALICFVTGIKYIFIVG